ncbi:NAD-dependent epimerase/dehydratase family protein [Nocardioides dongxiaopingii]|uniref:NAD(P)H-binding protein n=1 Tax=Nocardioides sp. S-1144 TaxID=2582905 RepID=UPI00110E5192|nr:NAD(P)H-binding protein [Nocardioides sp. S-1144]QCW51608.1 NAD-dependent epimerase/dehydratase family protein [Nocardioides sp. S-1144]
MLIVTGATGQLGSRIVERLLERVPADQVGVSVRDPSRATSLADRGVRVRAADFTEPATLAHALEGASRVLVLSAAIRGAGAVAANLAALDAARDAGAERVLYTSHQAASPVSAFLPQHTHAATEEHLAGLGVPFTALRNGFYASTLGLHLDEALRTGRMALPEDGPVSWTAHADLAEAAAIALASGGGLDGVTAPLTAPHLLDLADVAAVVADLVGRPVTRVVVADEEWAASAVARGMPPAAAEFTLGMFRAARAGEFAVTDPALESVLGRPAVPVREVLQGLLPQHA